MSGKAYYGPPGSYKTSTAVHDAIQHFRSGRLVVTNIRGLDDPNLIQHVLKLDQDVDLMHVPSDTAEQKEHWRRWFHWMPRGAYFLVDEINTIYPKSWTQTRLATFNYPDATDKDTGEYLNGENAATQNNRPYTVDQAFEMHRHYNWDFSVTSPSYNKIHACVKDVLEACYRHQNKGLFGLKGRYSQVFHTPENAGKSENDRISTSVKRLPKYVFKLYSSTATGEVRDTIAGKNILTSAPVLAYGLFLISLASFLIYNGPPDALKNAFAGDQQQPESGQITPTERPHLTHNSQTRQTGPRPARQPRSIKSADPDVEVILDYVNNNRFNIVGTIEDNNQRKTHIFKVQGEHGTTITTSDRLARLGMTYNSVDHCLGKLKYKGGLIKIIHCPAENDRFSSPKIQLPKSDPLSGLVNVD